ncbi:hypothetical protein MTO96_022688 [Rhipicephalus appendiculatus]
MAAHVDVKRVVESIKALRTVERKHLTKKPVKNILDEDTALDHDVYLQFTLKKIPYNKTAEWIKINLPHSLTSDKAEICLFTELLADAGVTRNIEIIPLRQLRTEYTPYESKRNLCAGYDVFLGDSKILAPVTSAAWKDVLCQEQATKTRRPVLLSTSGATSRQCWLPQSFHSGQREQLAR